MGAGGACGATPLTPPTEPSGPPRGTWRGGTGFGKRGQDNTPGNGRAEGPAAGGGARAGKQAGEDPPLPTRPPHSATPPPHLSRARLLAPQKHRGAAAPPDAFVLLPLSPAPFPSRAAHGWRRGSRAGRGGARPPRAALGTDRVNDPSAGSPTETLLRLLLPLDSQVRPSSQRSARAVGRPRRGRSEGLTKPSNR